MPPLIRDHHRKLCERWNTPGDAHYLTCSCFDRKAFLSRDRTRQWLIESIGRAKEKHDFHLWAYVVMPEHFHLLIWPQRKQYEISDILESIKLPVTRKARHFVLTQAPAFAKQMEDRQPNGKTAMRFWLRGGGYDRNLYSSGEVWEKIGYIHKNPIRRGLCERLENWEWSSARDYLGGSGKLKIDFESLPIKRK